jgi:hypothetical protein
MRWLARRLGSCRSALSATESTIKRHACFAPDHAQSGQPTCYVFASLRASAGGAQGFESVVTGLDRPSRWPAGSPAVSACGGIIGALLVGKWIAAEVSGGARLFPSGTQNDVVLTLPQVAATLAAMLVAYRTFNGG